MPPQVSGTSAGGEEDPGAGSQTTVAEEDGARSNDKGDTDVDDVCLPEGEDCVFEGSLDDACCGGFHCCPVFKICVVDWWEQ
jgi:hypothetical protein